MTRSNNQQPDWRSGPTEREIESILTTIKPLPTARLNEMMGQAPWQIEEKGTDMIYLKRLSFIGVGAALMLLVVVTAVLYTQSLNRETPIAAAPIPTRTPVINELSITRTELDTLDETDLAVWDTHSGLAYGGGEADGRLFLTLGDEGVGVYETVSAAEIKRIPILDPATGQPVLVRDVAWGPMLWLGPPAEGLIVLTDPFQDGSYLHLIDPESGAILNSFQFNNNIAFPAETALLGESVPSRLVVTGNGELYADRVFTFAGEEAGQRTVDYHYLLRSMLEGRILNPLLVGLATTSETVPTAIADLAYQTGSEQIFAAVRDLTAGAESGGIVQKYNLIGTPGLVDSFDGESFRWQEFVALNSDEQGHVYILLDNPDRLLELDPDDQIVAKYYFTTLEDVPDDISVVGYRWINELIGQPIGVAVSPDGSHISIVHQDQGKVYLITFVKQ